jgi:hypothetical protein
MTQHRPASVIAIARLDLCCAAATELLCEKAHGQLATQARCRVDSTQLEKGRESVKQLNHEMHETSQVALCT